MAMRNFCTLFDMRYLSRGLALYESLKAQLGSDFRLYVLAMNDDCYHFLNSHSFPNLIPVKLSTIEDRALKAVKESRTPAEYCWTCTSSWMHYLLETFQLPMVTYCDADTYFFGSPEVLFNEMGSASVLITPHFYTPEYDQSNTSGEYCVQFLPARQDSQGRKVIQWWRQACLQWCYNRAEEGRFGDQKYLDDWPERFKGVHVSQNRGGGVAPWNAQQYRFSYAEDRVIGHRLDNQETFPVIFYHFHQMRWHPEHIDLGQYRLGEDVINHIYKPYLQHLMHIAKRYPETLKPGQVLTDTLAKRCLNSLKRHCRGTHNIYKVSSFYHG